MQKNNNYKRVKRNINNWWPVGNSVLVQLKKHKHAKRYTQLQETEKKIEN